MVLRGLIEDGMIKPLEPLPADLPNGTEIEFEVVDQVPPVSAARRAEIEAFFDDLNADGGIDAEDLKRFHVAIEEERRLAKEYDKERE